MQKKSFTKSRSGTSRGPRKCWEDNDMVMAINAVKEGGLCVSGKLKHKTLGKLLMIE